MIRLTNLSQKQKQWLWFVTLWCGGFLTLLAISSVIKLIMNIG